MSTDRTRFRIDYEKDTLSTTQIKKGEEGEDTQQQSQDQNSQQKKQDAQQQQVVSFGQNFSALSSYASYTSPIIKIYDIIPDTLPLIIPYSDEPGAYSFTTLDPTTISLTGADIDEWADYNGSGLVFSGAGATRPTYDSNQLMRMRVTKSQYLAQGSAGSDGPFVFLQDGTGGTLVAVYQQNSQPAGFDGCLFTNAREGANPGVGFRAIYQNIPGEYGQRGYVGQGSFGWSVDSPSANGILFSGTAVGIVRISSAQIVVRLNGYQASSSISQTLTNYQERENRINNWGYPSPGAGGIDGGYGAIAFIPRVLSDTECEEIETWASSAFA